MSRGYYIIYFTLYRNYIIMCIVRVLKYRLKRNNLLQRTSITYKLYYYCISHIIIICVSEGAYYTIISTHNNKKTARVSCIITNGSKNSIRTRAQLYNINTVVNSQITQFSSSRSLGFTLRYIL